MTRYHLRLTQVAARDLEDLYEEGFLTLGEAQADRYFDGLLNRFDRICEAPLMYPAVDHIRSGYRRSVYEKHCIFFVIDGEVLEIRAVVKRQDMTGR